MVGEGRHQLGVDVDRRLLLRFLAGDVVEADEVIVTADRDRLAIRSEGDRVQGAGGDGDREAEFRLVVGQVPYLDAAGATGHGERCAVLAKGDSRHGAWVADERAQSQRGRVPEAD